MVRAVMFVLGALIFGFAGAETATPPDSTLFTEEEILAKYRALTPSDSDFKFSPPAAWSPNIAQHAPMSLVRPADPESEASKTVDGQPATTWTAHDEQGTAELVLDLGRGRRFDRLVVFNRSTDQRGTSGGNNAVKRIVLSAAVSGSPDAFRTIGEYDLEGPVPICFKRKNGGQMCAFIDRREPNVVRLPATSARYVRVELDEAFWNPDVKAAWQESIAVSEIMLFDSRGGK